MPVPTNRPGRVVRWMEYIRRVHRDLVPAIDRLQVAHERRLTQRLRAMDEKPSKDLKAAELEVLMDAPADLRELVEQTHDVLRDGRHVAASPACPCRSS